jgi:hypothetical protein
VETPYDWITVGIFAGLIVLFLQRSSEESPSDSILQYLFPSAGCAVANYFGNEGNHIVAVLLLLAVTGYTFIVLKPFRLSGPK